MSHLTLHAEHVNLHLSRDDQGRAVLRLEGGPIFSGDQPDTVVLDDEAATVVAAWLGTTAARQLQVLRAVTRRLMDGWDLETHADGTAVWVQPAVMSHDCFDYADGATREPATAAEAAVVDGILGRVR